MVTTEWSLFEPTPVNRDHSVVMSRSHPTERRPLSGHGPKSGDREVTTQWMPFRSGGFFASTQWSLFEARPRIWTTQWCKVALCTRDLTTQWSLSTHHVVCRVPLRLFPRRRLLDAPHRCAFPWSEGAPPRRSVGSGARGTTDVERPTSSIEQTFEHDSYVFDTSRHSNASTSRRNLYSNAVPTPFTPHTARTNSQGSFSVSR